MIHLPRTADRRRSLCWLALLAFALHVVLPLLHRHRPVDDPKAAVAPCACGHDHAPAQAGSGADATERAPDPRSPSAGVAIECFACRWLQHTVPWRAPPASSPFVVDATPHCAADAAIHDGQRNCAPRATAVRDPPRRSA